MRGILAAAGVVVVIIILLGGGAILDEELSHAKLKRELLTNLRNTIATDCNSDCDITKEKWNEFLECFDDKDDEDRGWRECTRILQEACPEGVESPVGECIFLYVRLNRAQIQDVVDTF